MSYPKLAEIFKYSVVIREERLAPIIAALVAPNSKFPNGSSFAVTTDTEQGKRLLWLSEASLERCTALLKVAVL